MFGTEYEGRNDAAPDLARIGETRPALFFQPQEQEVKLKIGERSQATSSIHTSWSLLRTR